MQSTNHILMIKPAHFGFNKETATNNYFQQNEKGNHQQNALEEFDSLVNLLKQNKILVTVIDDSADLITPDAIFPNNWISFDEEYGIALFPMYAVNRRLERKKTTIDFIKAKFLIQKNIDLSYFENSNKFLEGTGSMVLDRDNKISYASLSPRTTIEVLNEFCKKTNYTACTFTSTDINEKEIYHTNVMMCVADKYVVICLESIKSKKEFELIKNKFTQTKKEIIEITLQQLNCFAGNMLQVKNTKEELFLIMSSTAYKSLTPLQIQKLERYNTLLHTNINTIETIGGGSVRCMMAEVFLPKL